MRSTEFGRSEHIRISFEQLEVSMKKLENER